MAQELTYALITPYSLSKSRTGGIIGRLLTLAEDLDLIAARMYAPRDDFVDRYAETIREMDMDDRLKSAFVDYLNANLRPGTTNPAGNRCPLLLFRGENAIEVLKDDAVGSDIQDPSGDTVRGAYGDFIVDREGRIKHFEPAVLVATDAGTNIEHLKLFADFAESDGGVLDDVVTYPEGARIETTLVILKPDNFTRQSVRPGNIIDMFSRTGLRIIAMKVLRMSVAQGEEFYGPLVDIFRSRLKPNVVRTLREELSEAFDFEISDENCDRMADMLKDANAVCEFNKIVEYMTGINPSRVTSPGDRELPGRVKCLALLYQGEDAVEKIRERLGATDPGKAASTTCAPASARTSCATPPTLPTVPRTPFASVASWDCWTRTTSKPDASSRRT